MAKQITLGSQVAFVSDASRKGAVVAVDGDRLTVRLKGGTDTVTVDRTEVKGSKGRPAKIVLG